jgi:hypothetical protein
MMTVPDLLNDHVQQLGEQGYTVEVIEQGSEIGIVFHNYPIPDSIWNRETVDLLVITHPSYPNAKMDMFWVDPAIARKDGGAINGGTNAGKLGKTWQQFSWHVQSWNPAHDSLITYLDVVNERLRRNE